MAQEKRNRTVIDESRMVAALTDVKNKKMTLHKAGIIYGIPKSTLYSRFKKVEVLGEGGENGLKITDRYNKYASRQVFTDADEELLSAYLRASSQLNYGLTMAHMRDLAYKFAVYLQRSLPSSWEREAKAGKDWARGFLKRHRYIF